jgi:preprotein translocase subunit YajC
MIAMILIVVGITMYIVGRNQERQRNKLKELEETLDRYYKEREQRLKDNELIK